jgi:hypothetical protein
MQKIITNPPSNSPFFPISKSINIGTERNLIKIGDFQCEKQTILWGENGS